MPGPFDYSDPAWLNANLGGGFADPSAPPQAAGPLSIPGIGQLPPGIANGLRPVGAPPMTASPGAPSLPGLGALPASVTQGLRSVPGTQALPAPPPPGAVAPPPAPADQVVGTVDNSNEPNLYQDLKAKAPAPKGAKPAAGPDPFDTALGMRNAGIALRQKATEMTGQAVKEEGDAEAPLYAEGNRQADQYRAQQQAQYQRDLADQQRARDELGQVAKQYADSKIDQNRFWHDRSTANKVGLGIAMALGGLGAALTRSGPTAGVNPALQIIQAAVQQDIQLQMADREKLGTQVGQKGAALDRAMTLTRDNQATMNTMIAGAYDRVSQQVKQVAAQSQSKIAQASALDLVGQLQDAAGSALNDAAMGSFNRNKQQQELALQRQNTAIAGGHLALAQQGQKFEQGMAAANFGVGMADRTNALVQQGLNAPAKRQDAAIERAQKLATLDKTVAEANKAKGEGENGTVSIPAAVDTDGTVKWTPAVNKDGSAWVPPKARQDEFQKKFAAQAMFNDATNSMLRSIKEHGGESSWLKSDDYQKRLSDLHAAELAMHDTYGVTGFRPGTLEMFDTALTGGVDPTSFVRDASASLREGVVNVNKKVNYDAHYAGYTGADIAPADTSGAGGGAADSPADKLNTAATEAYLKAKGSGYKGVMTAAERAGGMGDDIPVAAPQETVDSIWRLADLASKGDAQATELLKQWSQKPDTKEIVEAAQAGSKYRPSFMRGD